MIPQSYYEIISEQMICPKAKAKKCTRGNCQHKDTHNHTQACDNRFFDCPKCIPCEVPKEEVIEVGDYCKQLMFSDHNGYDSYCIIDRIEQSGTDGVSDTIWHTHVGNDEKGSARREDFVLIHKGGKPNFGNKGESKMSEKSTVTINAKKLLELEACDGGFKEFVEEYGKGDTDVLEVYRYCGLKLQTIDASYYPTRERQAAMLPEYKKYVGYQKWLKEKFPEAFVEEKTYKIGDIFVSTLGLHYMLAKTSGKSEKVALIGVARNPGCIWQGSHLVDDVWDISQQEFNIITDGEKFDKVDARVIIGN